MPLRRGYPTEDSHALTLAPTASFAGTSQPAAPDSERVKSSRCNGGPEESRSRSQNSPAHEQSLRRDDVAYRRGSWEFANTPHVLLRCPGDQPEDRPSRSWLCSLLGERSTVRSRRAGRIYRRSTSRDHLRESRLQTVESSKMVLRRRRSWRFARRMAGFMRGATRRENPAGSPRLRCVMLVPPPWESSNV
jgi:hypothetical protein